MMSEDLVGMARAAEKDDRLSDGALYGKLTNEIERLRAALTKIAEMKPESICDSGFVHGPVLLLSNCQREARAALRPAHKR